MIHLAQRLRRSESSAVESTPEPERSSGLATDRTEHVILEALDRVVPRETIAMSFARRERELGEVFAALTVDESRIWHQRLTRVAPDDVVANRFARLLPERRQRLLTFLADARRREAMRGRQS